MKTRYFNSFEIKWDLIIKKSLNFLNAEYIWLEYFSKNNLTNYIPNNLKQINSNSYQMKYYKDYELLFFKDVKTQIDILEILINKFINIKININNNINKLIYDKVIDRIKWIENFRLEKYLKLYNILFKEHIGIIWIQHWDLHSLNILIKDNDIKIIDPRWTLYWDIYYDLAKFYHWIYYWYIINDLELDFNKIKEFEKEFIKFCLKYNFDFNKILVITSWLFLSMIPLHKENNNHQKLFLEMFDLILNKIEKYVNI